MPSDMLQHRRPAAPPHTWSHEWLGTNDTAVDEGELFFQRRLAQKAQLYRMCCTAERLNSNALAGPVLRLLSFGHVWGSIYLIMCSECLLSEKRWKGLSNCTLPQSSRAEVRGPNQGCAVKLSAQATKQKQHKTTHPLLRTPRASKNTCYIEHLYSALSRAERVQRVQKCLNLQAS